MIESQVLGQQYLQKGVKHLYETGVNKVPEKYILPLQDRPDTARKNAVAPEENLKLPVIDFAELMQSSTRPQALESLSKACEQYGFFQVQHKMTIMLHSTCTYAN